VLKRWSDAQRAGDRILAVIRGSSQEDTIRGALEDAGLEPAAIEVVECHGTALGDPVEAHALGAVLGAGRPPDQPVLIGSIKGNIGHTDAAAGIAGLLKMILAVGRGQIPPSLHFQTPNPLIRWPELPVRVVAEPMDWPVRGELRRAGVSSFGSSGTNAHVVLEQASPSSTGPVPARGAELVMLSARSAPELDQAAHRLREHLIRHPSPLPELAATLARRTHYPHRRALCVDTVPELLEALQQEPVPAVPAPLVFVFPGQGAAMAGRGRALAQRFPPFARVLLEVEQALDMPLQKILTSEALLEQTRYAQPALFALSVACAALLRSLGLTPSALLGHSVGEIAAAHVAGVLSLQDAARLVAARGRLMQQAAPGAMLAVRASEAQLRALGEPLSVAAYNSEQALVLSGSEAYVHKMQQLCHQHGLHCARLPVRHAFHSPDLDPLLPDFRAVVQSVTLRPPQLPLLSSLTADFVHDLRAEHFVLQMRQPVRFAQALRALPPSSTFLELGPSSLLPHLPGALPLLHQHELEDTLRALGILYVQGHELPWASLFPKVPPIELPAPSWLAEHRMGGAC
jgi:acyl transferase domain-containing protein